MATDVSAGAAAWLADTFLCAGSASGDSTVNI